MKIYQSIRFQGIRNFSQGLPALGRPPGGGRRRSQRVPRRSGRPPARPPWRGPRSGLRGGTRGADEPCRGRRREGVPRRAVLAARRAARGGGGAALRRRAQSALPTYTQRRALPAPGAISREAGRVEGGGARERRVGARCRYKSLQANDCKPNDCKPQRL